MQDVPASNCLVMISVLCKKIINKVAFNDAKLFFYSCILVMIFVQFIRYRTVENNLQVNAKLLE